MGKIFVLGNSALVKKLGYECKEIPNLFKDSEIHNWLILLFQNNDIEKLVIEIENNPELSLKIGLHIRLMLGELRVKTLIPIVFVSTSTLSVIMKSTGIWSHLLVTKGVYFTSFENIKDEISAVEGIMPNEYRTGFLNIIKILPDETIGRHSLANIWGAYQMDNAANTNTLANDNEIKYSQLKLYFKYMAALNFDMKMLPIKIVGRISIKNDELNTIDARNKKILLIDDEADKGWELILRKVFSNTKNFVVIKEKIKNYDAFSVESKQIIENETFDLYLIDLRLNGLEEETIFKPDEFSGMNVLQKIKSFNQGNQVIIFTASNKVWNLKALLDAGADGYYLKESPEYGFSKEFSKQNYLRFKEDAKDCFEKNYLQKIYNDIRKIDMKLAVNQLYDELRNQLNLFWNIVLKAKTKNQFAYAYVTLYLVIEMTNNLFVKRTVDGKWEIDGCGNLLDWNWEKEMCRYENTGKEIIDNNPPEWQKIAGLYFQKWKETDYPFLQNMYWLIIKRNGFIHNDKMILEKQDDKGKSINQDVYTKEGIIKLFEGVNKIINFLT